MKTVIKTILALFLLLVLLYILLLRCRRKNRAWAVLERFRYAHRGLHDSAQGIPENSLAAFRRAVDHGFGAELDVHLTRDGRLAVVHDDSLLRTAGVDKKVSELTAAQLAEYRLEGTEEKIPFLEEVLPLFEGRAPLIVELKVEKNAAALAQAACETLEQFDVHYCIESFHPSAVRWLMTHRPRTCRGQLSMDFMRERSGLNWFSAFAMKNLLTCFLTRPDFIAYDLHGRRSLSLELCRAVWGAREVSWTVRTQEELDACEADRRIPIFENFIPRSNAHER